MAIYTEKVKDKTTGKMVDKKIDGKTQYYIRTYVTDEFGKKKQITRHNKEWLGRDGYWKAQQEENRIKNESIILIPKKQIISVNELAEFCLIDLKKNSKPSTIKRYSEIYNIYVSPYFNKFKNIHNLTTLDILNWHNWIDKKSVQVATKQKIHSFLKMTLDYGCKFFDLDKNVCNIVGNFKYQKGIEKKQMEFLTYDEFKKFIQYEKNEIYKDFFNILFFTGMRRGELLALETNDLNLENQTLKINKSINPKNGQKATVPKTSKSNRELPILNILYPILKKIQKNQNGEIYGLEKIKPTTLTRKCQLNCKKAGITKNIRIHDFRHSFVALCIECNVEIEKISEYVGHENISTTYDIYGHLYPHARYELVDKINNFLSKQDQKQDQNSLNQQKTLENQG